MPMDILILEPYFTGSHAAWAKGYQKFSQHRIEILSLSGHSWKWRMHGGAISLARQFLARPGPLPDLIIASDMLDLTTFLALTRSRSASIPSVVYFHENQLTYPWSPQDRDVLLQRDIHYGFINYQSALAANGVYFNSDFHRQEFLGGLTRLLRAFPDHREMGNVDTIAAKSQVLPLGLDLARLDEFCPAPRLSARPLILWNHRWEYDKNPSEFFQALFQLDQAGADFELVVLGEQYRQVPEIFQTARERLRERIVHFGYARDFAAYANWLWQADIAPVTSHQDFFGISVVEAIYCNCLPLLPDRLAYREHIPAECRSHHFYQSFEQLVSMLGAAIRDIPTKSPGSYRHFVEKYRWPAMAPIYDAEMEKMISS
jgi:glycosyltransferase involved in cell wall biosynthesis